MKKTIVCLANSRKFGGRCIAGKDIYTGEWIRPVSKDRSGELFSCNYKLSNGDNPKLMDILQIGLERKNPKPHQPENYQISQERWKKIGTIDNLEEFCDYPETLWDIGDQKDRIPSSYMERNRLDNSLYLIQPESIAIDWDKDEQKARADFDYNNVSYDLSITDPNIISEFEDDESNLYVLDPNDIYLCLSIGEPFHMCGGDCFKLVAAVFGI